MNSKAKGQVVNSTKEWAQNLVEPRTQRMRVISQVAHSPQPQHQSVGTQQAASMAYPRHSLRVMRDQENGVDRCPVCTWELEDGGCQQCGPAFNKTGEIFYGHGSQGVGDGKPLKAPRLRPTTRPELRVIRDKEDGVDRCPICTWELEDAGCQQCGLMFNKAGKILWDDCFADVGETAEQDMKGRYTGIVLKHAENDNNEEQTSNRPEPGSFMALQTLQPGNLSDLPRQKTHVLGHAPPLKRSEQHTRRKAVSKQLALHRPVTAFQATKIVKPMKPKFHMKNTITEDCSDLRRNKRLLLCCLVDKSMHSFQKFTVEKRSSKTDNQNKMGLDRSLTR